MLEPQANAAKFSSSIPPSPQLPGPRDVVIDNSGNIIVISKDRLVKLDPSGNEIWATHDGMTYTSNHLAVDSLNNIYVDNVNSFLSISDILKFNSNGVLQGWLGGCNAGANCDTINGHSNGFSCTDATCALTSGNNNGQFRDISGMAVDAANNIYIVDDGQQRIQKFNSAGTFLTTSGIFATFLSTTDMTMAGSIIYLSTSSGDGILTFDSGLNPLVGQYGSGEYFGVAVSGSNVYAIEQPPNYNPTPGMRVDLFANSATVTGWLGGCNAGTDCDTVHQHSIGFSCTDVTCSNTSGPNTGQLANAVGLGVDMSGNIYVADSLNNRIEKFNSAGTFLSRYGFSSLNDVTEPTRIQFDSSGNAYVADGDFRILKLTSSGAISSIISGTSLFVDSFGLQINDFTIDHANNLWVTDTPNVHVLKFDSNNSLLLHIDSINDPGYIAVDGSNNVYISRDFGRIDKFDSGGNFQGWLGGCNSGTNCDVAHGHSNGLCSDATCTLTTGNGDGQFGTIKRIAFDISNNMYVIDGSNQRVEKFNSAGIFQGWLGGCNSGTNCDITHGHSNGFSCTASTCSTAISGSNGGQFDFDFSHSESYLSIDSSSNMYVIEGGNHRIQKFNSVGTFLNQFGTFGYNGNGKFLQPSGMGFDNSGNIYVTDNRLSKIQKFNSAGTFLSTFGPTFSKVYRPNSIAIDANHNVYIAQGDLGNVGPPVLKFNSLGTFVNSFGGKSSSNQPASDLMEYPFGIAIDSLGNTYVADDGFNRILKFNPNGVLQGWLGGCNAGTNCDIAHGHSNGFSCTDTTCQVDFTYLAPSKIKVDSTNNIFVAGQGVKKFNSAGILLLTASSPIVSITTDVAVDSQGNFYTTDYYGYVAKFNSAGTFQGMLTGCDSGPHCDIAHGHSNGFSCTSNVDCNPISGSGDGQFYHPRGIAVDSSDNIYVADTENNRIEVFDSQGNFLSKFGTIGFGIGEFDVPLDVEVDNTGKVYVVDQSNNRIQIFAPVVVQICMPTISGTWDIISSCTLANTATAPGDITIQSGVVLTIPSGKSLNVDTVNHHIIIKSGGGLLIKAGGKLN